MENQILFYIVILLTNIIHGITGFAGTILAMPPSLMLVGYDIAKPILNVLAIFSGVYVFVGNYKSINWKELARIVVVMALGIVGAVYIKGLFIGKEHLLYKLLGLLVIGLSVQGLYKLVHKPEPEKYKKLPEPGGTVSGDKKACREADRRAQCRNLRTAGAGRHHSWIVCQRRPATDGVYDQEDPGQDRFPCDHFHGMDLFEHPCFFGRCAGGAVGALYCKDAWHLGAVSAGGDVHRQQAGDPYEPAGLYETDLCSTVYFGAFASGEITPAKIAT